VKRVLKHSYDVVVVGSGFGGSVAALRATEKGYRVGVLEAGRRFAPADFPPTNWRLRRFLFMPRLGLRGIQRITLLRDVLVLSGAGVGGGSLVYAGVLYEALDPELREELAPYYETVRGMLGAAEVPFETPAEDVLRRVAERMGGGETFRPTTVAVDFDTCVRCGGCMVGCRYGAKNTLDRNYLRLAEEGGARIHAEREAVLLRRAGGRWEVVARRPGWLGRREVFRAEQVVVAAGVLGTLKLLFRSGLGGPRLGENVRTNSESLVGASAPTADVDYSVGVAIGSSFFPSPDTHIEPVRYPRGSNLMAFLGFPLRGYGRRLLAFSPRRWSERTVILLVMQTAENALRVRWTGRRLTTAERTAPARIPEARTAVRHAAQIMDGVAGSAVAERFGKAATAHILGGACVGAVVDEYHRVFGEPGLHVVDGSTVGANLGVNPSLTIAALAERALAHWPDRGEADLRPPPERPEPTPLRA
jgi:cholesterol oxidase